MSNDSPRGLQVSPWDTLQIDPSGVLPLPVQLADQLTWLIASGQLVSGTHLPTIRKLANHLQINLHTIRAAYKRLEMNDLVSTRRGIGSVVLDFDASKLHRANSGTSTHAIGLIVPSLAGPFYSSLLEGVQAVASENRFFVIVSSADEDARTALDQMDMLVAKGVDGVLFTSDYLPDEKGQNEILMIESNLDFPIVHLDRPDQPGYSITFDAENTGQTATQHMIDHGHRQIALLTPLIDFPTFRQIHNGYLSALQAAGIDHRNCLVEVVDDFTYSAGHRATLELIKKDPLPDAIFVAEDSIAIGALKALRDQGLDIPGDIALVGANNFEIADFVVPRLTTVHTSAHELGVAGMQMMMQLISGNKVQRPRIVLPCELIPRDSCGCPDDP